MSHDGRVIEEKVLSPDGYRLKKTIFDLRRRDGSWQRQSRETWWIDPITKPDPGRHFKPA